MERREAERKRESESVKETMAEKRASEVRGEVVAGGGGER